VSDHYFTADPGSAVKRQAVVARVWGHELALQSASGVFAAGRVDTGTAVLFRETRPPTRPGRYLDLGCGYGVIACALATALPQAEVWAIDVNDRAREACRDNARNLGLSGRVHVHAPADVPADMTFDEIWSNPPIRIGKQALHELLLTWLRRIRLDGRAVIVVSKNLGADSLQRWLVDQGWRCDRLGSTKGFRVFEIRAGLEARCDRSPKGA
jgi:16S rRNA (guanine1207-N2)-methyltransferase